MKKISLCFILAVLTNCLAAQTVKIDSTFGVNGRVISGLSGQMGNPYGQDLGVLPNGKIILGGTLPGLIGIEKYEANGMPEPSFSSPLVESNGLEIGLFAQKNGKILLTGENLTNLNAFLIRTDSLGHLDLSFGQNGMVQTNTSYFMARNVFQQSDEKVIVFGDEWTAQSAFLAQRFLADGSPDLSFANSGKLSIDLPAFSYEVPVAMIEQPDHKLIFAGSIGYPTWNIFLVRVDSNGELDLNFGEGGMVIDPVNGNANAYGIALQADGKILISGDTDPSYEAIVVRYNTDGTRDVSFGNEGVSYFPELNEAMSVAVLPDGKILSANWAKTGMSGTLGLALTQLLPDGQRDQTFGANGIFRVVEPGMRPRAMALNGNKVTVSARKHTGTTQKRLFNFLLDLNVGTLSPNNPAEPTLWIYPNPVLEQFNLQFSLTQNAPISVQLLDMQGKRIQTLLQNQPFESGDHTLNLSCPAQLPSGNYVLSLEIDGKTQTSVRILKH